MDYHKLTDRQRKILELLVSGKTNKEISAALRITENTVEYHLVKLIYPILGVRTRSAASAVYLKLAANALRKSVVDSRRQNPTMSPSVATQDRRRKEIAKMKYELKAIKNLDELKQVYEFAVAVLGLPTAKHTLAYYTQQFEIAPQLLIYTVREGRIIGCALASIEDDHILVGPVAVAQSYRNVGIGTSMLREVETQAKALGHNTFILGSAEEAEGFYLKCGFNAHLFVQYPESAYLAQLKSLNKQYAAVWEAQTDGWTRLMLRTPTIDKSLQQQYESQFPNCSTQTIFIKEV
jgi:DNA-binding CsgD family transcriptional regulator/N-acetylglutamate synthase-like GNAT family acetyltransferase